MTKKELLGSVMSLWSSHLNKDKEFHLLCYN